MCVRTKNKHGGQKLGGFLHRFADCRLHINPRQASEALSAKT